MKSKFMRCSKCSRILPADRRCVHCDVGEDILNIFGSGVLRILRRSGHVHVVFIEGDADKQDLVDLAYKELGLEISSNAVGQALCSVIPIDDGETLTGDSVRGKRLTFVFLDR